MNDWSEQAIAITDNTLPNYDRLDDDWPRSNPQGYAEWFKTCMESQFEVQLKSLAESLKTNIEDVPVYRVKTPLQRAIQILKRHRDIMFIEDQENKPISIIITTLAAHAYNNEADIFDALLNIVQRMPNYIETRNGISWVSNPVNPLENFADKWQEYPKREQNFRFWLQQVCSDLNIALKSENIKAIGEALKPHLGEKAVNKALEQFPQQISNKSRSLIQFNVPHRQSPMWPIIPIGWINITAQAFQNGFPCQIHNDSEPLPKHCSLRFEATTNILQPYKVYWQVVNTGYEARVANSLRGEFYSGDIDNNGILIKGGRVRKESTLYTGMHWVECFIIKDGLCVARSGEFVVNIQ